jgi:Sulfatase
MVSSHPTRPLGFRFGLLAAFCIGLGLFKGSVIGVHRLEDLFLGFGIELCFWGGLWVVAEVLERALPKKRGLISALLFLIPFYASAALVFSYTYFFDSAVERKFSLLDTDIGGMVFFLRDVLPVQGWAILLTLLAWMHAGAYWAKGHGKRPNVLLVAGALFALAATAMLYAPRATRVATPLYDIVHDYHELWTTEKVTVEATTKPFMAVEMLDKSDRAPETIDTPYKKVLVFVMETMTAARLADEAKALKQDTLFVSGRAHCHLFDRYFPNNQDSRTGMLDILGSRLIPYEAYRDADSEAYMGVAHLPSLLTPFQRWGYKTAFAVSQTGLEVVVTDLPWDTLIHLHDTELATLKKSKLCFQPYEFENSCEDTALLPKVFDFIDHNERAFLFQEFIWGHAYEYNAASGRTNAEYYSSYVDQIIKHLIEKNLLEETLIVVTSDHGFRDKGLQDQLAVYRIPLLFYSHSFTETHNSELLSHLDFKDLLFNEMQPKSVPIDHNPAILIQGPTATSLFASLTDDNDFSLVKTRGSTRLLLSHKNVGPTLDGNAAPKDSEGPARLMMLRDAFKRFFDARIVAAK